MNIIKKRLDKLPKNKIYKICQKMKVKCGSKDTKKKLCMRLLYPLIKYRMETVPEAVMEQMSREHNIGALLAQTSKDINISVGKLPEREYIQYLIDKDSSLPYENDFEAIIEDYVYMRSFHPHLVYIGDEDEVNYNPLYSIDHKTREEIENMILEVLINIYDDNPERADIIEERIGDKIRWARQKSSIIFRRIQEEKIYFLNKNFSGVDFSKIKDKRTDLRYVDFSNRNLSNANFTKVYLNNSNLRGADLNNAILRGADLWRADLRGADLRRTDLRGADLRRADLRRTDLRGADLRGADLRNTQNFETIFQLFEIIENPEEDLIPEDDLIQIDDHTTFPVGFDKENFTNYFS